jgi:predicted transcriptional regulator
MGAFIILDVVLLNMAESDIRLTAEWTTQADERIMEWLRDAGTHPSSAIGHALNKIGIEYSRPHISRRCNRLSEYGLLEKNYQNYSLTKKGELFLDGEIDLSTLEELDE